MSRRWILFFIFHDFRSGKAQNSWKKSGAFSLSGVKFLRDMFRNPGKKTQEYVPLMLKSENLNKTEVNPFAMSYFRQS